MSWYSCQFPATTTPVFCIELHHEHDGDLLSSTPYWWSDLMCILMMHCPSSIKNQPASLCTKPVVLFWPLEDLCASIVMTGSSLWGCTHTPKSHHQLPQSSETQDPCWFNAACPLRPQPRVFLFWWKQLGHKLCSHSVDAQIPIQNAVCRTSADPSLMSNFADCQTMVLHGQCPHFLNSGSISACWLSPGTLVTLYGHWYI